VDVRREPVHFDQPLTGIARNWPALHENLKNFNDAELMQ
jgi:hypothetical protein